jgi:hypothetical protein
VNGDGYQDFAISSLFPQSLPTSSYFAVIYGRGTPYPTLIRPQVNITGLGFRVTISGKLFTSWTGGVGDLNKDGIDDFALTASGKTLYIIYGSTSFPTSVSATTLNGVNGTIVTYT